MFRPAFSPPPSHRVLGRVRAAILTTGRRTITHVLRTVQYQAQGPGSSYHRVCSQRRGSTGVLGRTVMAFLLDDGLPPGPVLLAGDDTVTEPPGPNVFGKGRHRDGVRSPHRSTADRWGHTGVGIAGLVPWPVAPRPWALPVLVALDRPPAWARMQGTRHQTPAHMGRLLLARLIRGFPERHVVFGGDSRDGTSATARLCQKPRQPLTLVRTLYGEAAVYELPPPRPRHPIGRPRVKGQPRASPQEVVAHVTPGTRLTVAWDGGTTRALEFVTGTGQWDRIGEDVVAIRWVGVHEATGTHRDE